jgi:hypothetical protein
MLLQVPKGRNFHNRRQAKRSLRWRPTRVFARGAQASFGAQPTPVRTAGRLNFGAVVMKKFGILRAKILEKNQHTHTRATPRNPNNSGRCRKKLSAFIRDNPHSNLCHL